MRDEVEAEEGLGSPRQSYLRPRCKTMDVSDPYAVLTEVEEHEESSESSDSSDDDDLTDQQIESTIRLLKQVVESTPNDYQSRVQLIGLLRQQGDFDEVTEHREILAATFPLGESTLAQNLPLQPFNDLILPLFLAFSIPNPDLRAACK